jgi:uncharacterized lipoprotein YehR (DUF1307 family)
MKRIGKLLILVLAVALALSVAGCGASFDYDKDAAVARAKQVIELANAGDYEAIVDTFGEELKAALTTQQLQEALDPVLAAAGDFQAYKTVQTGGKTQNGVDYIIVVAVCTYENSTQTYTISMTADMLLTGFYIK